MSVEDPIVDLGEVRRRFRRGLKTSELIARQIVDDIVDRGLGEGDMLPSETAMLAEYEVGRASLREALRILEVHGLISIKPGPGGGPMVNRVDAFNFAWASTGYFRLSRATFGELVEARIAIEAMIAGLVAERRDPVQLERLREVVARGSTASLLDDSQYLAVAGSFHTVLTSLLGNRVLALQARALQELFTSRVRGALNPPEDRPQVVLEHQAIADAIFKGQSSKAERLMREHMTHFIAWIRREHPRLLDEVITWP
jgi:DNA-binding FadR family transcriptional regulator